jgi:NSS family neurotransmitter:Na+ symporter
MEGERPGPDRGATHRTESWGTRIGLVLAVAGNAVGLGNFLRFPAQAAQNGGGAFLIPYLVAFLLMGLPLVWVEWAIGRHGGQFGHHSTPGQFDRLGRSPWLKYVGVFGLFTSFTIAAYYCYIESWALAYVWHSLAGTFRHADPRLFFPRYLGTEEASVFALPLQAFFWFALTLGLNVWLLSRGLKRGIELAAKIGMPLLVLFGVVLAVRGLLLDPASDPGVIASPWVGLNFVWQPRMSGLLDPTTWLAAAGQIFFTLSVGMGSIHCYASYLHRRDDIALNGATAGWMNELVEVILGSAILIPIATAYLGLAATQAATTGGSGFSLGFLTLPTLFQNWGWFGPVAGALWFGLLFFAGITSSLAMGQPVVAFLQDEFRVPRQGAAVVFGLVTLCLGLVCVWLYPGGSFDEFDFWSGTFVLVVFALCESLIFAFVWGIDRGWEEISRGADLRIPRIYRFVLRYVTPLFILLVFLGTLVEPEGGDWAAAFAQLTSGDGWNLAPESIIGKLLHSGDPDYRWFTDEGKIAVGLIQDATRLLLLVVFGLCAVAVRLAWSRKRRSAP